MKKRTKELLLLEPLALLDGPEALAAVGAGLALPLAGGPIAFTLVRLIPSGDIVRAVDAPVAALQRLMLPLPPWAELEGPAVMGILNITPDSFSDGGDFLDAERAAAAAQCMIREGADIVDLGGESTRPDGEPVAPSVEQARVLPVIRALADAATPISIDTRNAATMAAALEAGATIVNDVSGLSHDPDAMGLVAARRCPVVLMHMHGSPAALASYDSGRDVAVEVVRDLQARVIAAQEAGIRLADIAVDPGIGFDKDGSGKLDVLRRLPLLFNIGCRILVGVSRKRFIGRLTGQTDAKARLPGSLAAALDAVGRGAAIVRVHDVAPTVQALRVLQGLSRATPPS